MLARSAARPARLQRRHRRARTRCSPGSPAIDTGSNPLGAHDGSARRRVPARSGAPRTWARTSRARRTAGQFRVAESVRQHGDDLLASRAPSALRSTRSAATSSWSTAVGNRVRIFNSAGVFQSESVAPVSGPGQFATPLIAAIDPTTHNIVVTDSGNRQVQIFNVAGVFPEPVRRQRPRQRAVREPAGRCDRPDQQRHRRGRFRQRTRADFQLGGCVSGAVRLREASGDGQFSNPQGVAIDPTSRKIFVVDAR